jgi:uncharacterized protein
MIASSTLTSPRPLAAALLLAAAAAADLALLLALPRLRVSFGKPHAPWLLFTAGRSALAALLGLVPLAATASLTALAGVQAVLTVAACYGTLVEPRLLAHTSLRLRLAGIGSPLEVALLTDLHVERWTAREDAILAALEERRPDLILLGGDLLNLSFVGEELAIEDARRFVARLAAPAGVYCVRGTVDVDPPEVVHRILDGSAVRLLDGERVIVDHRGARLTLVGSPAIDRPPDRELRLRELVSGATPPIVVLHHTPDLAEQAAALGVDLYLCGHTHGGQICPPLVGPLVTASRFGRRYARGLRRVGGTIVYTSRGLGLEGLGAPRIRFLSRPELVWIRLEEAPDDTA